MSSCLGRSSTVTMASDPLSEEIQDDLLKLNAVTGNSRQMIAEFLFQNYVVSL